MFQSDKINEENVLKMAREIYLNFIQQGNANYEITISAKERKKLEYSIMKEGKKNFRLF